MLHRHRHHTAANYSPRWAKESSRLSGSGYFALRLAQHVGATEGVYAVDVSPDMIRHLNRRVRDLGVLNVSSILAPPDDPLLPQPVDRFLIVDSGITSR